MPKILSLTSKLLNYEDSTDYLQSYQECIYTHWYVYDYFIPAAALASSVLGSIFINPLILFSMVEKMLISVVGNYIENDWQNPRTGERKLLKSFSLVLQNGNDTFSAEALDDVAVAMKDMKLKPDMPVMVSLSFQAQRSEKENVVRYFQRIRIEKIVKL